MASKDLSRFLKAMRQSMTPVFVEEDGGVFLKLRGRRSKLSADGRPIPLLENEWNHQHFDFDLDADPLMRHTNNYILAGAAEIVWQRVLSEQFPTRRFSVYVFNEMVLQENEDGSVEPLDVHPTLRLWTNDGSDVCRELDSV